MYPKSAVPTASYLGPMYLTMYNVFAINVPLAVRFATAAIGMRKAESPEYGRLDRDFH